MRSNVVSLFPNDDGRTELEVHMALLASQLNALMDGFRLFPRTRNTVREHGIEINKQITAILSLVDFTSNDLQPNEDYSVHRVFMLVALLELQKDALRVTIELNPALKDEHWRLHVIEHALKIRMILKEFERVIGI